MCDLAFLFHLDLATLVLMITMCVKTKAGTLGLSSVADFAIFWLSANFKVPIQKIFNITISHFLA